MGTNRRKAVKARVKRQKEEKIKRAAKAAARLLGKSSSKFSFDAAMKEAERLGLKPNI